MEETSQVPIEDTGAQIKGGLCPCCGRYTGPSESCPYCGETSANSMVRILRRTSILLALCGLVFLYLFSKGREIPRVRISDINPMMNYALVRVSGKLARTPYTGRTNGKTDYFSFLIVDGNRELRVAAYDDDARQLADRNSFPAPGKTVEAVGRLRTTAGRIPRLYLRSHLDVAFDKRTEK